MEDQYRLPPTAIQNFDDWMKGEGGSVPSLTDIDNDDAGSPSESHHQAQTEYNGLLANGVPDAKYDMATGDDPYFDLPTPDYDDRPEDDLEDSFPLPPPDDGPPSESIGRLQLDQLQSCSESFPSKYVCENPALIEPNKLRNPCLQSRDHKSLNKELKWNANHGIDVLQKSELKQELSRRRDTQRVKQIEDERHKTRTSFEKKLEEQANKLRLHERPPAPPEIAEEKEEPEFQRVHSKIARGRQTFCT